VPPSRCDDFDVGAPCELFRFGAAGELRAAQCGWVDESLRSEGRAQMHEWATATAVGSAEFVEKVKADLGSGLAIGMIYVSGTTRCSA
jgi:hypothetical protein